jgi:hypothetical protein
VNSTSIQGPRARVALLVAFCAIALAILPGCGRGPMAQKEYVWVSAPSAMLRDRVAALYNKVATVKNGDKLEVLDHQKRFVKVRTAEGQEGWIEQRNVVTPDIYAGFLKLASDNEKASAQGHAITRASLNMHLTPNRDSDHLYQLNEGQKVELLKRGTGEKAGAINAPRPAAEPIKSDSKTTAKLTTTVEKAAPPAPALEDWWLVRDAGKHVGWVLARMVDIDVPLDVAQYAEGQRIVGAYVLNTVNDPKYEPAPDDAAGVDSAAPSTPAPAGDYHVRPQYLVLLTEPHDGLPFDYNQARVFTWNTKRHRYETAYREHNVFGMLPVSVGNESFDKEGTLPTFTLHVQNDQGQTVERKYKLNGPIVRLVTQPGQEKIKMAALPKSEKKKGKPSPHKGHRR